MRQTLTIHTTPKYREEGVRIRKTCIGQRLFKKLFGQTQRITILVPGDDITSVEIKEEENEGESDKTAKSYE